MIEMLGNTRKVNTALTESGTATARKISMYGVKALSDLINMSVIVRASTNGSASATTMQINTLAATTLRVFKGNQVVSPYENWIVAGQLYVLLYDGTSFTAFPMSQSSDSSGTSEFLEVSASILDLENTSSAEDITNAFGGVDKLNEFASAVSSGNKWIRLTKEYGNNNSSLDEYIVLFQGEQQGIPDSSPNTFDTIIVLYNKKVISLVFEREEEGENYISVKNTTLLNMISTHEFPYAVLEYAVSSLGNSSQSITDAFGGVEKIAEFMDAVKNGDNIVFTEDAPYKRSTVSSQYFESYSEPTFESAAYFISGVLSTKHDSSTIKYSYVYFIRFFTQDGTTFAYLNAEMIPSTMYNDIYDYLDTVASNCPDKILQWYKTYMDSGKVTLPTSDEVKSALTSNNSWLLNKLNTYVNNGTMLNGCITKENEEGIMEKFPVNVILSKVNQLPTSSATTDMESAYTIFVTVTSHAQKWLYSGGFRIAVDTTNDEYSVVALPE